MATKNKRREKGLSCPNCGGKLSIKGDEDFLTCPYCETEHNVMELLGDSDDVKIQKIKSDAYVGVEKGWQKVELERIKAEDRRFEKEKIAYSAEKYKKSIRRKLLIAFTIFVGILCLGAFYNHDYISAVLMMIQIVVFIVSMLFGTGALTDKKGNKAKVLRIIGFLLIIPILAGFDGGSYSSDIPKYTSWSDIVMSDIIPEPPGEKDKVYTNTLSELSIYVHNLSPVEHANYIKQCQEKGFTLDVLNEDTTFEANNEEGYKLQIAFFDYDDNKMHLELWAPTKFEEMTWVSTGIVAGLPPLKSNKFSGYRLSEDYFNAKVGDITFEEFIAYTAECEAAGYNLKKNTHSRYFSAYNKDGHSLSIRYIGFNTIEINLNDYSN